MENMHLYNAGRGTYFDRTINIMAWTENSLLKIGRYCSIARNCTFLLDGNHRADWVTTSTMIKGLVTPEINDELHFLGHNPSKGDIIIGNDVWIGTEAMIMPGIHIGNGAVIAARSLVTKNVKPYSVVGGNPAEFLYYRFDKAIINTLQEIKWWDWPDSEVKKASQLLWNKNIDQFIEYALKINETVSKISITKVEDRGCKVFLINNTSKKIKVEAKFTTDLDIVECIVPLEMESDLEYWVSAPQSPHSRYIKIVDPESLKILARQDLNPL